MPADRVTSLSPWHVVLVLDDSGSMENEPAACLNEALKVMLAEMELAAKGKKPWFKVSIVAFGSSVRVIAEAQSEQQIDINTIATFAGNSGTTNSAAGLREAINILKRNPGAATDFRPYVFFFSDGHPDSDCETAALAAASELKSLRIAAGSPTVVSIGLGIVNESFMKSIATNAELYIHLQSPQQLIKLFPIMGTIVGSWGGEAQINQGIKEIVRL